MGDPSETHGAFSWVELLTADPEAAKKFYVELFGWELAGSPVAGEDYTVAKVAGKPVAGIMKMPPEVPPGVPPHWGVFVTVDDVDATVTKAQELGAQVARAPTDVPGVGRFAVLRDPQGAIFAIIHYEKSPR
ncbi:MAG: glyoxalase [Planctomycetales bacterium 4484_123]|nr:MAG: glyoxalase [Planctomycetales bacterium 4484_123]